MSSFGDFRASKGFASQQALAEASGVSAATIQRVEANPGWAPRSSTVVPLAKALGVEPDELRRMLVAVPTEAEAA